MVYEPDGNLFSACGIVIASVLFIVPAHFAATVPRRLTGSEDVISRAEVIDSSMIDGNTVTFGTTIIVADEDTDEENTYTIVGPYEADISKGWISTSSPIAKSLIGKKVGDSAEVNTPRGSKSYEILDIKVS